MSDQTNRRKTNARRPDPSVAQRALDEARDRKAAIDAVTREAPREYLGRGGLDPARYGDWEQKGIANDF
ncbi:MAG TPA: DUF1674 domain-containing protein [Devosiaceae bacterium]